MRYRVNYGNGQVWEAPSKKAAFRHIAEMDLYQEFAYVQWFDEESGEWFRTGTN